LAAGLDCRAFRLDWPDGVRLFELDLPQMFAFKEPVLASAGAVARCVRVVVAVDLRGRWADALTGAGFDPGAATGWLAEGLLPHLHRVDGDRLLATVTELSAPGSRAVFDHLEATAAQRPAMRATSETVRQMGAQLMPTVDGLADWLACHSWQATLFRVPALGEGYGRPLPADADLVASNATVLITANR
jgi:methyltransferase (TIGR00027 family)